MCGCGHGCSWVNSGGRMGGLLKKDGREEGGGGIGGEVA